MQYRRSPAAIVALSYVPYLFFSPVFIFLYTVFFVPSLPVEAMLSNWTALMKNPREAPVASSTPALALVDRLYWRYRIQRWSLNAELPTRPKHVKEREQINKRKKKKVGGQEEGEKDRWSSARSHFLSMSRCACKKKKEKTVRKKKRQKKTISSLFRRQDRLKYVCQ